MKEVKPQAVTQIKTVLAGEQLKAGQLIQFVQTDKGPMAYVIQPTFWQALKRALNSKFRGAVCKAEEKK